MIFQLTCDTSTELYLAIGTPESNDTAQIGTLR
jgi:hypothetical protein